MYIYKQAAIKKLYESRDKLKLINDFLKTKTLSGIIEKIQDDPSLSDEEKQALINKLLHKQQNIIAVPKSNIGQYAGGAGGLLLGLLLSRNTSPLIKALIVGGSTLGSALVGKYLTNFISPSVARPINSTSYNIWKGI